LQNSGKDEEEFPDVEDLKVADVDFLAERENKEVEPDEKH